jgi:hypothetical protein
VCVHLAEKFVQLELDDDTTSFLKECDESTMSLASVYGKPLLEFFVSPFLSRTSVNGCVFDQAPCPAQDVLLCAMLVNGQESVLRS